MASTDDSTQVTARNASNLAIAFKLAGLSPERRRGMEVFYAFCRVADDIADEPGPTDAEKHAMLDAWRATIRGYFDGSAAPHDALGRELGEVVKTFGVPKQPLLDIIDGVSMDIVARTYETFEETRQYCYGVASAVGLVSIRIFGCRHSMSEEFALAMGYALQFTNILRDVVEDRIQLGRVYLPQRELRAFGLTGDDLLDPAKKPEATAALFRLQYFRAKHFFNKTRRLVHPDDREALKAAFVMGAFYEAILEKIKASGFHITEKRIRLSKWEKLMLMRRTLAELKKPQVVKTAPKRVVVIGGGVAGIASAVAFAGEGHTVTLLEAKATLGGRATSFRHAATGVMLDNGQHAVMGCYDEFLKLCDTLGVRGKFAGTGKLDVKYRAAMPVAGASAGARASSPASDDGIVLANAARASARPTVGAVRESRLCASWPEPVHGLGAVLGFSELSFGDKLAVLRLGVALKLGAKPKPGETGAAWLARLGQTPGAVRAIWEPFCIAALNETLATGDAGVLRETLRRSLFGDKAAGAVLLAKDGLAEVFEPELALYLEATGGALKTRAQVKELRGAGLRPASAQPEGASQPKDGGGEPCAAISSALLADGSEVPGDAFVLATAWKAAGALAPAGVIDARLGEALAGNEILNVHLFTDRPVTREAMTGVLDSPIQWVFDRTAAGAPAGLFRCAVTLSAPPADWASSDAEAIVRRTVAELEKAFPESKGFSVVHHFVCKCKDATFATLLPSGVKRPAAKTVVPNLFLAGDWTDTGLPATIEAAAQSGFAAERALG